ncbi:MAG: hypothetical protein ABR577_04420 [Pyrinomonadaceae bacterium]
MAKKDAREALQQSWFHAHEEDTDTEKVYRPVPENNEIPPGRGREVLTLNPDGTMVKGGSAPNDARTETDGTWTLKGDELVFHTKAAEPRRTMKIASVSKDRLIVKK